MDAVSRHHIKTICRILLIIRSYSRIVYLRLISTGIEQQEESFMHLYLCDISLFYQLHAEVQRLEELKLKNIQNFIKAIREEIAEFWNKCFYSTDQRQAFLGYNDGK